MIDFSLSTKKLCTMCIDFFAIVIEPVNMGEKERKSKLFTTIAGVKYLNGLLFQLHFSYNQY